MDIERLLWIFPLILFEFSGECSVWRLRVVSQHYIWGHQFIPDFQRCPETPMIYIISRLGLIFLVFYCFSSMPAAVYKTVNWNTIFPHFS